VSLPASVAAWAANLPPAQKLVLLCLADHADEGGVCWPSIARLADRSGLARASIVRSLKALADTKHITVERGSGRLNHYRVHPVEAATSITVIPVSGCDRSHCETSIYPQPGSQRADTSLTVIPDPAHREPLISQESSINRPERARVREPVSQSDQSQGATGKERARGRPEGLQKILDHVRQGFAAGVRR